MERDREAAHGHSEAEEDESQHMQAQEPGAPVEFLHDARVLCPLGTRQTFCAAWDRSRALDDAAPALLEGRRPYDREGAREQAALGYIFDLHDRAVTPPLPPVVIAPPHDAPGPVPELASASSPHLHFIEPARVAPEASGSGPVKASNTNGAARRDSAIVLGSGSDSDDHAPRVLRGSSKDLVGQKGKGKHKVPKQTTRKRVHQAIVISDDSEEDRRPVVKWRASPPKKRRVDISAAEGRERLRQTIFAKWEPRLYNLQDLINAEDESEEDANHAVPSNAGDEREWRRVNDAARQGLLHELDQRFPPPAAPPAPPPVARPVTPPASLRFEGEPTPPLAEQPVVPVDEGYDQAFASIIAIVPDVLPSHVSDLLRQPRYSGKAELVLEVLFSEVYPKIKVVPRQSPLGNADPDQKRASEEEQEQEKDYLDPKTRGATDDAYRSAAIDLLFETFNVIPKPHVRSLFQVNRFCYAPTWVQLDQERSQSVKPYRELNVARKPGKGKGKEQVSVELEREKAWLVARRLSTEKEKELAMVREAKLRADGEAGLLIECGCCFSEVSFDDVVQCVEAHLFCKECAENNASDQIGLRNFTLPCMSGEGCLFHESEYSKFLPNTSIAAIHKIRMEREVDLAGLDGLAKCPFCPYACVIDNPYERLFHCMREGCEVVSCRECGKVDHLPRTCLEMDADRITDARHTVEEAMTQALMRKCPNCANPYVKEAGCNKMSCPSCRANSCFVCGNVVSGYEHFTNAGTNAAFTEAGATCPLWDRQPGEREFIQIEAARVQAGKAVQHQLGAQELEDLRAAAPPPPPMNLAHLPELDGGFRRAEAGLYDPIEGAAALARVRRLQDEAHAAQAVRALQMERNRVAAGVKAEAARLAAHARKKAKESDKDAKRVRLTGRAARK